MNHELQWTHDLLTQVIFCHITFCTQEEMCENVLVSLVGAFSQQLSLLVSLWHLQTWTSRDHYNHRKIDEGVSGHLTGLRVKYYIYFPPLPYYSIMTQRDFSLTAQWQSETANVNLCNSTKAEFHRCGCMLGHYNLKKMLTTFLLFSVQTWFSSVSEDLKTWRSSEDWAAGLGWTLWCSGVYSK